MNVLTRLYFLVSADNEIQGLFKDTMYLESFKQNWKKTFTSMLQGFSTYIGIF